jgi:hypothetical protein
MTKEAAKNSARESVNPARIRLLHFQRRVKKVQEIPDLQTKHLWYV